jgi:hypothetical protein
MIGAVSILVMKFQWNWMSHPLFTRAPLALMRFHIFTNQAISQAPRIL